MCSIRRAARAATRSRCRSPIIGIATSATRCHGRTLPRRVLHSRDSSADTHLAVTDYDELRALSLMGTVRWIGLADTNVEGTFVWVTRENLDGFGLAGTAAWAGTEPNNQGNEDCAEIVNQEGQLNDL